MEELTPKKEAKAKKDQSQKGAYSQEDCACCEGKKETMKKAPTTKKAPKKAVSEAAALLPAVMPAIEALA